MSFFVSLGSWCVFFRSCSRKWHAIRCRWPKSVSGSDLHAIFVSRDVGFFGLSCFCWCRSLFWVTFKSMSRLRRIETKAFHARSWSRLQSHNVLKCLDEGTTAIKCSAPWWIMFETPNTIVGIHWDLPKSINNFEGMRSTFTQIFPNSLK
jgi:hypothetical protein